MNDQLMPRAEGGVAMKNETFVQSIAAAPRPRAASPVAIAYVPSMGIGRACGESSMWTNADVAAAKGLLKAFGTHGVPRSQETMT
jgi:hypothetical protein